MNDDQKPLFEEIKRIGEKLDKTAQRLDAMDLRFDAIDARFDAVDARFDRDEATTRDRFDEMQRHLDVTAESLRGEIRLVAEGVLTVDDKLSRFRGEMDEFRTAVDLRFNHIEAIVSSRSRQNGHHTD